MTADEVGRWLRARQFANQLTQESFAATSLSAADAFGAACGLMDLASRFRPSAGEPDVVRQRDEREAREAWERLRGRCRLERLPALSKEEET